MNALGSFAKSNGRTVLITLVVLAAVIAFLVTQGGAPAFPSLHGNPADYPEVKALAADQDMSFQEYSDYFRKLADEKGAVYAYQVLRYAPIGPNIDLHLLGHVVGDMLYKQEGIDGVNDCTPDFRNACSHSVVIGVLNDHGPSSLPDIAATCKKAPGGKGAYTMCFHGLGHGVLAYNGYKLDDAVAMCQKAGTPEYQDREYIECVGGAIMEMIAGVHDPGVWEKQVGNYFKDADPLYPCDAAWMPAEVKGVCYVQLTPHLFTSAGMELGNPDPNDYPKAFGFCNAIPKSDPQNRTACYGGFGKEFTVLAQGRDVRDIGLMQAPALQNVRDWCALAGDAQGESDCNSYALSSLFWGGENVPDASFLYCSIASGDAQDACYRELTNQIGYYLGGAPDAAKLCARLPEKYQPACSRLPS